MSRLARDRGGSQVALDSALQALDLYRASGSKAGEINGLLTVGYDY